jgi:putative transposase
MTAIAAVDMFMVATATFKLPYAVIILSHHRRRVIHFEVTQNPTQTWLAQQITEAFQWDTAPRYLLRDRDTSLTTLSSSNDTHLRRVLSRYFRYYQRSGTHLSLNKDCPDPRSIQPVNRIRGQAARDWRATGVPRQGE